LDLVGVKCMALGNPLTGRRGRFAVRPRGEQPRGPMSLAVPSLATEARRPASAGLTVTIPSPNARSKRAGRCASLEMKTPPARTEQRWWRRTAVGVRRCPPSKRCFSERHLAMEKKRTNRQGDRDRQNHLLSMRHKEIRLGLGDQSPIRRN
jgi:hypothetical protein